MSDPRNARKHDRKNLDAIVASLRKHGQYQPIIVNERNGQITAGNGRYEAAKKLGWEYIAVLRRDMTPAQQSALAIADNRSAELATWDAETLDALLDGINLTEPDLLTDLLLDDLLNEDPAIGETDPDAVPEPPAEPITNPGDLWTLGDHRLLCGDSTKADNVANLICGELFNLIYDPPWDLDHLPTIVANSKLTFCDGMRASDIIHLYGQPTWIFAWDCVTSWYAPNRPLRRMKLCLWYGDIKQYQFNGSHYGESGTEATVTNTRGTYRYKPDCRGKHLSDVFVRPITQEHKNTDHHHGKPIDWVRMLIANCLPSGTIYDPFLGSGTTLIAAEQLGRRCCGMEISPQYCDVIVKRWEDFTGKKAKRE